MIAHLKINKYRTVVGHQRNHAMVKHLLKYKSKNWKQAIKSEKIKINENFVRISKELLHLTVIKLVYVTERLRWKESSFSW